MKRDELMAMAATEYERFAELAASLGPDDWHRPTACVQWDVKDIFAHVLGSMKGAASIPENLRQFVKALRRRDGTLVDKLSDVQVEEHRDLPTDELVAQLRAHAPRAAKGRKRIPAPLRRFMTFHIEAPGIDERWSLGFVVDVILTRDTWMHRTDVCRAVGREPLLTPEHDGRLVAEVVAEWARRHGRPFRLVLEGPAGGKFGDGDPADEIRMDAVEFCRILSGRGTGEGLLAQAVAF